ncbi:MAG: hypothetical protein GX147_10025 [Deltaproteobacteria bacterium]|nr:hypothetical protein [Deltaproteobacteria bacterium]
MTFQRTGEDVKRQLRQKDLVLEHLKTGAPLTQDMSRELYGCRHVASRISELKKDGHIILSLRNDQGCSTYLLLSDEGGRE